MSYRTPQFPLTLTLQARVDKAGRFAEAIYQHSAAANFYGKRAFPAGTQDLPWGRTLVKRPTNLKFPYFRALWNGFTQPDMMWIHHLREEHAFATENWADLYVVELNMLNEKNAVGFSKWECYNNMVCACLGQHDGGSANAYRKLRDAQTDAPVQIRNWWDRTFAPNSTKLPAY